MALGVARAGGVLRLTLARPERQNRLDGALVAALRAALAQAAGDASVRVVVLDALGPSWCAGADLDALAEGAASRREVVFAYADLLADLAECAVPVVAEVAGAVRGGGVGLLCAADLVVMGDAATVALPEARVGLWPMMVGALLPRVVSPRVAMQLALTGEVLPARACLHHGLATRVGDPLETVTRGLVDGVLRAAPGATRLGRAAWRQHAGGPDLRGQLHALGDALLTMADTGEAAEGLAAFRERRPPGWAPG